MTGPRRPKSGSRQAQTTGDYFFVVYIGAKRHLVAQDLFHAARIHHQQHKIDRLRADLETPAAFAELREDGSAPFAIVTAAHQALAQAIALGLSEARRAGGKVPRKRS